MTNSQEYSKLFRVCSGLSGNEMMLQDTDIEAHCLKVSGETIQFVNRSSDHRWLHCTVGVTGASRMLVQ